jgi:hypothetical protein
VFTIVIATDSDDNMNTKCQTFDHKFECRENRAFKWKKKREKKRG